MRNIIFVILFILTCACAFVFCTSKPGTIPEYRGESGSFSAGTAGGVHYSSDSFGVEADYGKDWVYYDGVQLDKRYHSLYSDEEIEGHFGFTLENIAFLGGFAVPEARLDFTIGKNATFPDEFFSTAYAERNINNARNDVTAEGGKWGTGSSYVIPAKDSAEKIMVFYYDYEINGEYRSVFQAKMNAGGNTLFMNGDYINMSGLQLLLNFIKNDLTVTGASATAAPAET